MLHGMRDESLTLIDETCPHGFPKPANCIDCMNEGNLPVPPRARTQILATGSAKHDGGTCRECDRPIRLDDSIALVGNGASEVWLHEG